MIHEPLTPNAVFVAWRDPKHHRCYPVARLARVRANDPTGSGGDGVEFEFTYVKGMEEAKGAGFKHVVPFEHLDRVYRSRTLFPFFGNRIMAESRPGLRIFLNRLMLNRADPLEVLSRTGGIRATDSYEVFPLPRFDPTMPGFRTFFLVHALRHFPPSTHERIDRLQQGERLFLMQDCQNEFDPNAMALRTEDRVIVGHVPSCLLFEVYTLENDCEYMDFTVAKVNLPAPLDQRLLCELETCWPEDYQPYVAELFQPLATGAVPSQALIGEYDGGIPIPA